MYKSMHCGVFVIKSFNSSNSSITAQSILLYIGICPERLFSGIGYQLEHYFKYLDFYPVSQIQAHKETKNLFLDLED